MIRLAAILCLCASAALSQTAPTATPEPAARPDPEDREETLIAPADSEIVDADAPDAGDAKPDAGDVEAGADAASDMAPIPMTLRRDDRDYAACLATLDSLGTVYEEQPRISEDDQRDCGIERPLLVSEIVPGIALNPDSRMRCDTAKALATWMTVHVVPTAAMINRGAVTAVDHGSTYVCRNRASGGRMSEHAFGNAIDIMGFRFEDGSVIAIEPRERDGTLAEAFQDAVRATACLSFTTVLGPGTDADHADHLHLDIKARNGGFRLCQ